MNTIEETKIIEDDPFSITTPPPSPPSVLNYHHHHQQQQQRLSYSLSFNNNNNNNNNNHPSTLLHRSQSLALDNNNINNNNNKKKRPHHLNKLWRQSTTTSSSSSHNNNKDHFLLNKELPLTPNILLSQSPMDKILATSPPTLKEFHQWIHHYLSNIEDTITIESLNINNDHHYQQEINSKLVIAKDCLLRLINTLDHHLYHDKKMNMVHLLHQPSMDSNKLLQTLQHIHLLIKPCLNYHTVLIDSSTTETNIMETPCLTSSTIDYSSLWPDHLDANIHWFHDYFYGKDYLTLFIPLDKTSSQNNNNNNTYAIVNVIYELISSTSTFLKTSCSDDDNIIEDEDVFANEDCNNDFNDIENSQYRIIIRIPKCFTKRYVVTCAQAYDYTNKHGGLNVSFKTSKSNRKSALKMSQLSTHFSSQYRYLSAALHSVCPELNLHQAFLLPSSITSSCGIEKELLHIDGIEAPPHYKFGVLNIKKNQTKEEDFFANTGLSSAFDKFLNILGDRIKLKGYNGYTAGLDTRTGETGDTSVVSKWRGHDIMFHVAPLMPFLKNDKQQVQRKRYIGNDIVSVVFLEEDSIFNPESIRSKFIHVYIVVRQEITNGKIGWRVEVVRRNNVPEFGPSLPTPPIFYDENVLHQFLTIKLVNAENAALKSENFVVPNFRARAGIIENLVEKGIGQKECITMSSIMVSKSFRHRRPKSSSGSQRLSRASLRSIRSTPDSSSQYLFSSSPSSSSNNHPQANNNNNNHVEMIPPVPTPTRSTMLQDLKNFALRRAPTLTHPKSTSSKESSSDGIGKKDRNGSIGSGCGGDDTLSILNNNNNNNNNNSINNYNNNNNDNINNNDNNNNDNINNMSTSTTTTSNTAQQTKKPSYTSSFPSMASNLLFRQNGNSRNDDSIVQSNKSGGSILAAKARTVFFNRTTSSASLAVNNNNQPPKPKKTFSTNTLQQHSGESGGGGLRHKAQNLVINAVRRSGQNGNQQPIMPTLKE